MTKAKETEIAKFCREHDACKDAVKWALPHKTLSRVWQKCERGDWMIWMLRQAKKINKRQVVQIAVGCAENVLPIFEKKYPKDDRPRKAIEAAKAYIKNPSEKTKEKAYASASAAYAYAAYASAYASSSAAAAAAYAAAYASASAAYAYAAYAYASDADASSKQRKIQADMIREIMGNPFKEE